MKQTVLQKAEKYSKKRHKMRTRNRIAMILAVLIVFCTTYALILPAITLEGEKVYCAIEEHEHVLSCYSDSEADVESPMVYEQTVSQVELTDDWRDDIIAVAQTQLGYTESEKNYAVMDDGETIKGYTRYGEWYGNKYGDWAGMFVSFCLNYAGVHESVMPFEENSEKRISALREMNLYHSADSKYKPKLGDLVFFDLDKYDASNPSERVADHVGFVCELVYDEDDSNKLIRIKTIEGDADNSVCKKIYEFDEKTILGYGEIPALLISIPNCDCGNCADELDEHSDDCLRKALAVKLGKEKSAKQLSNLWINLPEDIRNMILAYAEEEQQEKAIKLNALIAALPEVIEKSTSVDGLDFSLTGPFEDSMEANVSEINEDALAGLKEYVKDTEEHLISGAYDISIVDGDNKAEFENPIKVAISGLDIGEINPKYLRVKVYHLVGTDESDVATISDGTEVEIMNASIDEDGNLNFETDDFSVFYFTVDFHYEDITFKIDGYSSILLSQLFKELGLPFDASNANSVVFSDETYISISSVNDDDGNVEDWLLVSEKPFSTEETLKIEFVDGTVFELKVTDNQTPAVSADDTTAVNVTMTGISNGQNVTVTLYNNGVSTGKTITLNASNNWKGSFTNLEEGSYSVEYTTFDGYIYGIQSSKTEGGSWNKVSGFTNGKTYVLVNTSSNTNYAVQNSSGTNLSRSSKVNISNGRITSAVSNAMQWYYDGYLQNVETSNYLMLSNNSGAKTNSSTKNNFTYTSSSYIRQETSTVRYLRYSNSSYSQTTSTSGNNRPTAFTLYEKSGDTDEINFSIIAESRIYNPKEDTTTFEHNKTIDYLNDGVTNPDTDLKGEDYYRLYMDMTGKSEPIDLLIVVDGSSSMTTEDMEGSMRRDDAITKFLNGSTSRVTSDGFISYFLGLNSANNVSVVQFYGLVEDVTVNSSTIVSNQKIDYTHDSTVLLDWTGSASKFVDCECKTNSGTNYEAGLLRATEVFSSSKVRGNGHRKVLLFLSDGVPTFFQINANDIGTTVDDDYVLTSSDTGRRWGEGYTSNYPYCKDTSKLAFDDFKASNPGVTVFTVGVSKDISETNQEESRSPEVLQYMATNGNGAFYGIDSSMSELKLQLESIFYPRNVTITDELSKYVRYYENNPDVKVTMKEIGTNNVTVLYENGAITSAGRDIFDGFTYTAGDTSANPTGSTGTIVAKFDSEYQFDPKYTYTVSFNVKTTQTAYSEFANEGKYNAVGDAKTDYGTNNTSSEKSGFYSNNDATVSYEISGVPESSKYKHPVVQVATESLIVKKEWLDGLDANDHDPIQVVLVLNQTINGETTQTRIGEPITLNAENNWTYTFSNLVKQQLSSDEYKYTVEELNVPNGYEVSYSESVADANGVVTWTITNYSNIVLTLQKVDSLGNTIRVAGVTFELYEDEALTLKVGDKYMTDKTGKVVIENIEDGKVYWLVEKSSPPGYALMNGAQPIKVTANGVDSDILVGNKYLSTDDDGVLYVKNFQGYQLPMTGGNGTYTVYAFGVLLMIGTIVLGYVLSHRRKSDAK